MPVTTEPFGTTPAGEPVDRCVLDDGAGVTVALLTYGATVQAVHAPGRHGTTANVALGFADLDGYLKDTTDPDGSAYLGATVGRYANRIGGAAFELDGTRYELPADPDGNLLHGGPGALHTKVWQAELPDPDAAVVRLSTVSSDGEQGFPGTLTVAVTFRLTGTELSIQFEATTDAPTVVNLTNHTYWNLAGEGSGDVLDHIAQVAAERYVPVDEAMIPLGELAPVEGTPLDLRADTVLGTRVREGHEQLVRARGLDFTYVIDGEPGTLREAAAIADPSSGRTLTLSTTEPGVQLYTGNFLDGSLVGTSGRMYRMGDGLALEPQHLPDSPNQPAFPTTVLRPGETLRSTSVYAFGVI
ncbi:MAG TPA: aldose epimerase family protein [Solirubrobacteraceae bacterium]|nr:aldose epimerase family protein [Solirubrobacteraceae bacterium]